MPSEMQRGLLAKLDELRRQDAQRRLFGARDHRYELAPRVDVDKDGELLRRVESLLGSPLPEDYRAFLTELGNGGAGPYYGILSLEESVDRLADVSSLGRDFPLEADVCFGEIIGQPESWDEHAARLENDPAYAARWEELQAEYLDEPYDGGWIPICGYGCGDFFILVLRGPRRGTVWVNSLDSATGMFCLEIGFAEFYERWLDDALRRVREGDFEPVMASYAYLQFGNNPRYASA